MERRGRRKLAGRDRSPDAPLTAADPTRVVPAGDGSAPEGGRAGDAPATDLQARRQEIARLQERALHDAETARLKLAELERREQALTDRERNLEGQTEELKRQKQVQRKELERLSGLTVTQAKQLLIADVEHDARRQAGRVLLQIDEETKRDADRRARNILSIAMGRLAGSHASETTTRLIELPSEEMKGRIIGREGRNIRAIESLTGVDLIIDETPNAVVISSFDGVRREIARLMLERLIADGRIQPATIEEAYEKAKTDVEATMAAEGERAELEAGVHGIDPELLEVLGRLRFRTSYGQNVLDHLIESSKIAGSIAAELGVSVETAKRATLLHDIGKAVSHEVEGSHAQVGASMARRNGESEAVAHAIEAHHNEVAPQDRRGGDRADRRRCLRSPSGSPWRGARALRDPAARSRGGREPPPRRDEGLRGQGGSRGAPRRRSRERQRRGGGGDRTAGCEGRRERARVPRAHQDHGGQGEPVNGLRRLITGSLRRHACR